jgi:lactate 2-monooxygenase
MSVAPTEQDPLWPSRNYGAYQISIYTAGLQHHQLPTITCDFSALEEQARKFMDERSFNYVAGGAGERATMDANRLAFRQWKVGWCFESLCLSGYLFPLLGRSYH